MKVAKALIEVNGLIVNHGKLLELIRIFERM